MPTLTTVKIPEGVDGKAFAKHLLNNFGIEIGGGLGDLAGVSGTPCPDPQGVGRRIDSPAGADRRPPGAARRPGP